MRKFIAVIFLGLVAGAYSVQAACFNECKAVPECAKMGYKLEKEIFCPDGYITCPFDSQYIWCKEYTCKDGRYSDTKELTGEKGYVCDEVDYHHRKCYHCHCDPDPEECQWSNLNKGVGELGDRCCDGHYASCRNLCQDKVSVPAHAHGNKESCTGCNITKDIITSWSCDDWYDQMGEACYARQCPDGYTITDARIEDCGRTKDQGWTWESKGQSGEQICGKCTAKSCSGDYSTDYPGVDSCGDSGSKGWTWNQSGWSGDDACGKCTMKQCPEGFESGKASAKDCGGKGESGWNYEQSGTWNGDTPCGKCIAKGCPNNSAVEVKDCGKTGDKGYRLGTTAGWNGDKECKKCEPLQCSQGTATTESGCGDKGNKGWSLGESTGWYNGETACKTCVMLNCPNGSKTEWVDPTKCGSKGNMNGWTSSGIDSYNGQTQCYTCAKKNCPDGYNTNKPNVGSCGTSGASGWDWDGNGYSGDEVCGKCTPKTCPTGYSTEKKSIDNCGTTKDKGWTFEKSSTNSGENVCGKCTARDCESGYNTNSSVNDCSYPGTEFAKKVASTTRFNGDATCYKCECTATNDNCPWTEGEQGMGELGKKCCNGQYQSCKNLCKNTVEVPEHAQGVKQSCTGCGITTDIVTSWTCNEGYTESADGKKCDVAKCPEGYDVQKQSGPDCGNESGWSVEFSGKSGEKQCGKCKCTSECKWDDKNKGEQGTLTNKCCNGKYANCNSRCGKEKKPPENANCSTYCTACELPAVCTAWECDEGFQENKAGTACCINFATSTCAVGSVFFSDGTCATADMYAEACPETVPSKPVGVVYWVDEKQQGAKVINLRDLGKPYSYHQDALFNPENPYNTGYLYFKWGAASYTNFGGLTNWDCDRHDYREIAASGDHTHEFWTAGASYTHIIADIVGNDLQFAAPAALAFYPYKDLKDDPIVGQGQWYLPTIGELMDLYGYNYEEVDSSCYSNSGATGHTKDIVNATLKLLQEKKVDAKELTNTSSYCSSSEEDEADYQASYYWVLDMDGGRRSVYRKTSSSSVRVSLEIGCPSNAVSTLPTHATGTKCTTLNGETKYKSFECEDGYAKNKAGTGCVKGCEVGDVYYADASCGKVKNYVKGSFPEPIGVIYYVSEEGTHSKVINLKNLGREDENSPFDPENPYNPNYELLWGFYSKSILENYRSSNIVEKLKARDPDLYDGKGNTDRLLSADKPECKYEENTYSYFNTCIPQAAQATRDFYPEKGVKNDQKVGQGQWYLPAIGELMDLYGYDNSQITSYSGTSGETEKNIILVNNTLIALKYKGVNAERLTDDREYWTSTEYDDINAWRFETSSGYRGYGYKLNHYNVRASLEIGCPSDAASEIPEHATGSKCTTLSGETKYKNFVCNSGYRKEGSSCVPCEIGDVYYADGTCGKVDDYVAGSIKIPVGVIYYVSEGGHGKVINLKDLSRYNLVSGFIPKFPYSQAYKVLVWGYYKYDVPELTNYDASTLLLKLKARDPDLYNGKGNTDRILSADKPECNYAENTSGYYGICIPQAAQASRDFYPTEMTINNQKVGAGHWYLPAIGELMDLYGYDNSQITTLDHSSAAIGNSKELVNKTLEALKAQKVTAEKLSDDYYWSSTECNDSTAWQLHMGSGNLYSGAMKSLNDQVRVSLQY